MTIKEQLETLVRYFHSTHRVGHTRAMLYGLARSPRAVGLMRTLHDLKQIKRGSMSHVDLMTLAEIDKMHGMLRPMLLDNSTVVALLTDALARINELERELASREPQYRLLSADPNAYKKITVGDPPGFPNV